VPPRGQIHPSRREERHQKIRPLILQQSRIDYGRRPSGVFHQTLIVRKRIDEGLTFNF
jgi:hypothetical protein